MKEHLQQRYVYVCFWTECDHNLHWTGNDHHHHQIKSDDIITITTTTTTFDYHEYLNLKKCNMGKIQVCVNVAIFK